MPLNICFKSLPLTNYKNKHAQQLKSRTRESVIGRIKSQRETEVTLERKMERSLGEGEGEESGDGSIVFLEEDWDLLCFFFFIMVTYL